MEFVNKLVRLIAYSVISLSRWLLRVAVRLLSWADRGAPGQAVHTAINPAAQLEPLKGLADAAAGSISSENPQDEDLQDSEDDEGSPALQDVPKSRRCGQGTWDAGQMLMTLASGPAKARPATVLESDDDTYDADNSDEGVDEHGIPL